MARLNQRRPQNIAGNFYVDQTCIDCDTCRWMAPDVFEQVDGQSAVYRQPQTEAEVLGAMQALLSCPTASIGTLEKPDSVQAVHASFPIPVQFKRSGDREEVTADTVYHCGYHAESSYGAASYLVQRSDGNVLVDSPRFAPPLVKRLEALGGVRYLYLTHRDDVADHQKFHDHFGCDRLLHEDEINGGTRSVEIQLTGSEPITLAPDLQIIPVPGHTKGHTVLLYHSPQGQRILFTGDHLAWSDRFQQLIGFRNACWYSWTEQQRSMEKLTAYAFEWVLPGHGRRYYAGAEAMHQELQKCIAWMAS